MTIQADRSMEIVPLDRAPTGDWDELADSSGAAPFSRPGWVRAWAAMTGEPVGCALSHFDERLVAVYPVMRRGSSLVTAADWHTPHADVIGSPSPEFIGSIVEAAPHVRIDFATGATADAFRKAMQSSGRRVAARTRLRSPWVDLTRGWTDYRDSLSTRKWREIRRRRRRLDEEGRVTFTTYNGSERLEELLDEGFSIEGSGWKDASGTSIRSDAAVATFYRSVADWAAARGVLRLHFLRLDGRAIAFDLAFEDAGAEWLLKTGFDSALGRFSPGSLLRAEVLERAFDSGSERYEFLGGDDPWKLEWTDLTRTVEALDGYAPGFGGLLRHTADRVARWIRVRRTGREKR